MRHAHAFEQDGELIARMRRSSLLLNTQLRDLLTLAKGEAGRLELRPEPFEALALVEALADGVRELAQAKGLDFLVEVPRDAIFVVADGARVDQVLANLVVNSIRYTDTGQVRITLHRYDPGD
jgi:signal transduction histidine kinase